MADSFKGTDPTYGGSASGSTTSSTGTGGTGYGAGATSATSAAGTTGSTYGTAGAGYGTTGTTGTGYGSTGTSPSTAMSASGASSTYETEERGGGEAGKTLLIGLLGGVVSAAGYAIYNRLPEDQKKRIQAQVRSLVESRLNEIRQNFNI